MFVPRSHGGLELDLPTALEVIATLGRLDGSVGWTAMIGAGSTIFVPYLPRETYDQVCQEQSGHDYCRLGPACWDARGGARRLADQRTVAVS